MKFTDPPAIMNLGWGRVLSCFRKVDINAFGYFYSVGSVYTNNYIPKLALSWHLLGRATIGFDTSYFSYFWNYE